MTIQIMKPTATRFNHLPASLLAFGLSALPCFAATKVWDGGATTLNWGDAANWNTDGVPANGDTIQFNGGLSSGAAVAVNVDTYTNPASPLTFSNGAGFTLDFSATGGSYNYFSTVSVGDAFAYAITNNTTSGKSFTFSNGTQNFDIAAGGKLTMTGNFVVLAYGSTALSKTGAGELDLSGLSNFEGGSVKSVSTTGGILRLAVKPSTAYGSNSISCSTGASLFLTGSGSTMFFNSGGSVAVSGSVTLDAITLSNDSLNTSWSATTGAFNLVNGGGLDVRGQANVSIDTLTGTGKVYNSYNTGEITVGANGGSSTFDGVICGNTGASGTQIYGKYDGNAGSLSLIKSGGGSFTLTGACIYSGTTTVNGGTLIISGSTASTATTTVTSGTLSLTGTGTLSSNTITIASGALFNVSGRGSDFALASGKTLTAGRAAGFANDVQGNLALTGGTLNIAGSGATAGTWTQTGNLTLNGGSVKFDLNNVTTTGAGVNDLVAVTGNLTLTGSTQIAVNKLGANLASGTYTLISCTGTLSGDAGTHLTLSGVTSTASRTYALNTTTHSVELVITDIAAHLVWTGADATQPTFWDEGTTINWSGGPDGKFVNGDFVVFDDTATSTSVEIQSFLLPEFVTFNNSLAKHYTLSGSAGGMGGDANLVKNGNGLVTISNTNSYSGPTAINAGTISVEHLSNIGTNGPLGSGTQIILGDVSTTGTLQYTGANVTMDRLVTLAEGGGVLDVSNSAINQTLSGVISGAGGLTKTGAGTLTLTGTNLFTGATTINSGTLALSNGAAIADSNAVSLANTSGVSLVLNNSETIGSLAGGGGAGGNVILLGDLTTGSNNANTSYAGVISGTGSILKHGSGTLTLTGTNTYTGVTHLIGTGSCLSISALANINGSSSGFVAIQQGSTLQYTGTGTETRTGLLYWNSGAATVDVTQATAKLTFDITGGLRDQTFTKAGAGQLTLSKSTAINEVTGNWNLTGGILEFNQNHAGAITRVVGTVTGAAGTLIKVSGTGYIGNDNLTANWTPNLASLDIAAAAYVDLRGNSITVDSLTGAGTVANSHTKNTNTLTVGVNNGSGTFSGAITQTGPPASGGEGITALTKSGTGTQVLSGACTYTGATAVNGGALIVDGSLGNTTVTVASAATLGGTGTIGGNVTYSSGALALFTQDSSLTISGALTLNDNVVHLVLPADLALGTYPLATYNPTGSTGTFAATPLIDSGSLVTDAVATITTVDGTVSLIVRSLSYDAWKNGIFANGGTLSDKTLGGDPDGDQHSNLEEYAFDTDPTVSSSSSIAFTIAGGISAAGQPVASKVLGDYYAVFGRRLDYVEAGLTYTVEFSAGLDIWVANDDLSNPPVWMCSNNGTIDAMGVKFPESLNFEGNYRKPTFFRMKVESH